MDIMKRASELVRVGTLGNLRSYERDFDQMKPHGYEFTGTAFERHEKRISSCVAPTGSTLMYM